MPKSALIAGATALAIAGTALAGVAQANPYEPYEGTTLVVNFPHTRTTTRS